MQRAFFVAVALSIVAAGCRMDEPGTEKKPAPASAPTPTPAVTLGAAAASAAPPREPIGARGVQFVKAEPGDVAQAVKKQLADAKSKNRDLLIYEGATWCEPCQRFHAAAARGDLDAQFPNLTLMEFDADHDGERLLEAGYHSRFIPLFALPGTDGKSVGKQMEGSIKGPDAVAEISPRLKQLLGRN
jgi:hypothetical protein